ELLFIWAAEAVGTAWIDLQGGVRYQLDRVLRGGNDRYDLVVVAVQDERGYVDRLEVLGGVCLRERRDAVEGALDAHRHALQPELVPLALGHTRARPVGPVERG